MLNLNQLLRVTFHLVPHPKTSLFTMLLYAVFSGGTKGETLRNGRKGIRRAKENKNMTAVRDLKEKSKMRNEENYAIKTSTICNL